MLVGFHDGYQVHGSLKANDEDPLAWVTLRVGMLQHIQKISPLDGDDDSFEAELPLHDQLSIDLRTPREGLHFTNVATLCA